MIYPDETLLAQYLIQTHHIVRVLEYHPENQTVDVSCDMSLYRSNPFGDKHITNVFGNDVAVSVADPFVLVGIPVQQLRWGQFSIQCSPKPEDTGYIEVFPNDIRMWQSNGEGAEPLSTEMFLLDSAVFVPFIPNDINADPNHPQDNGSLVIKSDRINLTLNDPIQIEDEDRPDESISLSLSGHLITITSGENPTILIDSPNSDITVNSKTATITTTEGISITGDTTLTGNLDVSGYIKNPTLEAPVS